MLDDMAAAFAGVRFVDLHLLEHGEMRCRSFIMKRDTWRHLLRATQNRILDGDVCIQRQRRRLEDLKREGRDTALAKRELDCLIEGIAILKANEKQLLEASYEATCLASL